MKKNILEQLFKEAVSILKRSVFSDRKISGFETIIVPVERMQYHTFIHFNRRSGSKK